MFQLTCALTGPSAQVINTHNGGMRSIEEIVSMLQTRFGFANQTELCRVRPDSRSRDPTRFWYHRSHGRCFGLTFGEIKTFYYRSHGVSRSRD
jgi:hypothetical protein